MSERILVVEDDEQIAAIVRDGLTRMGYRVELAAHGPAALAAVRDQPCDLVVLGDQLAAAGLHPHSLAGGVPVVATRTGVQRAHQ